jgi:hypothetical protein
MALPEKQIIFSHLLREEPRVGVLGFQTWLLGASQAALGKTPADAAAFVDARITRLWNDVQRENEVLVRAGLSPVLRVVDEKSRLFEFAAQGKLGGDRAAALRWIATIGNAQFEYLGAALAFFCGAPEFAVTKRGGDRGVDFYALVPAWGGSGVFHTPHKHLRVVGQSKYLDGSVQRKDSDALISVLHKIRLKSDNMKDYVPDWFWKARGPVVGIILSQYGFASGTVTECNENGVLLAGSVDIAESIVSSRRFVKSRMAGRSVQEALSEAISTVPKFEPIAA